MVQHDITIYHSPDADDAFMFYALGEGIIKPAFSFQLAHGDVESLNHRARRGESDVTAASVHAMAYLSGEYSVLSSGASFGGSEYGPVLVARGALDWAKQPLIAVPGELTSAALALGIMLKDKNLSARLVPLHFEKIEAAVATGEVHGGVIIHEGQLTHRQFDLHAEVNLGEWWWKSYSSPLPLGVNAAKKSLGADLLTQVQSAVKHSIEFGLSHRTDALAYAAKFRRGLSAKDLDTFVGMYVNDLTVDMGEQGRDAIRKFLKRGRECGIIPDAGDLEFI